MLTLESYIHSRALAPAVHIIRFHFTVPELTKAGFLSSYTLYLFQVSCMCSILIFSIFIYAQFLLGHPLLYSIPVNKMFSFKLTVYRVAMYVGCFSIKTRVNLSLPAKGTSMKMEVHVFLCCWKWSVSHTLTEEFFLIRFLSKQELEFSKLDNGIKILIELQTSSAKMCRTSVQKC